MGTERAAVPSPPADRRRLDAAVRFLEEVKRELGGREKALYATLVSCLNSKQRRPTSVTEIREQVEVLLGGHAHLLASFRRFLPPPSEQSRAGATASDAILVDDEDDDVVLVSSSGALQDFPHKRHDCVVCKFPSLDQPGRADAARAHCPKCYCLICEVPAAQCDLWSLHALARDDASWRPIRDVLRATRPSAAPAAKRRRSAA